MHEPSMALADSCTLVVGVAVTCEHVEMAWVGAVYRHTVRECPVDQ
jgi:hypothetical protein